MSTRTDELPKAVKKEIRRLGELGAFERAAAVHRFHEGRPRKLWIAFNTNQASILIFRVVEGWREEEISEEPMAELRAFPVL